MHAAMFCRAAYKEVRGSGELGPNTWTCVKEFPFANQISIWYSHMTNLPLECNITTATDQLDPSFHMHALLWYQGLIYSSHQGEYGSPQAKITQYTTIELIVC